MTHTDKAENTLRALFDINSIAWNRGALTTEESDAIAAITAKALDRVTAAVIEAVEK